MAAVATSQLTGYLCATTLTTVFYLYAKSSSSQQAENRIRQLLKLYNITLVDRGILEAALILGYRDYEDAVLLESASRCKFSNVSPLVENPTIHDRLSHHADDMGARLGVPSSLGVLMRTTGVPKYIILGSMTWCIGQV
jgi:hypothetical protein